MYAVISSLKLYLDDFSAFKAQGAVVNAISNSMFEQTLRIIQENQALVDLLDAITIPSDYETLVSNGTVAALSRVQSQLSLVPSVSEPADESQQQRDLSELTKEMDLNEEGVLLQLRKTVVRLAGKERQYGESLSRPMEHLINAICSSAMQPQPYRPRAITQWLIDQIMTLIATSASPSSSSASTDHITPKQRALQYLAFCRVFSTILAFHRKRLGGRNHLILLILQSLLRPLFIPFAPAKSGSSAPSEEDHPYTAVHASAYSRLLSQIVDPPLAALQPHTSNRNHRNNTNHNNLNDPTKTAKSIAG
ncbi:MAG: hypothetical protein Q9203_004500, partial [Teloschistes exilis]